MINFQQNFLQHSRKVDFSSNPYHESSFVWYDQSMLDEVGFPCLLHILHLGVKLVSVADNTQKTFGHKGEGG